MNSKIFNVDCITSKANSTIVKIAKLMNKKERKEEKLFTLDGVKLFLEAYKFGAKIKYVVLNDNASFNSEIVDKINDLKTKNTAILCVNEAVFSKLTEENAPQGIITVCEFLDNHSFSTKIDNVSSKEKIIVLESLRDPGNVGAVLRNAAAFGIDRIVLSSDCADIYSQKVLRSAMGAIFKVKIDIVANLVDAIGDLKAMGRRVIATTLRDNSIRLSKGTVFASDVFVIGNEGHGVSEEVIYASDETMFIPMCENTESLNASVAAAILMWELFNL